MWSSIIDLNVLLPIFASILSFIAVALICHRFRRDYLFWHKQGIDGEWTVPFLGPLWTLLTKDRLKSELMYVKRYGRIYVRPALDNRPVLFIADPEVARQVLVKDFDVFTDHIHVMHPWTNKYQDNFLVWLKGQQWKRVRSIVSTTFTSGKIKRMFKALDGCANDLIESVQEQIGSRPKQVNLMKLYGLFTVNCIFTCGFGIKMSRDLKSNTNGKASNTIDKKGLPKMTTREEFCRELGTIASVSLHRLLFPVLLPEFILRYFNFSIVPVTTYNPVKWRLEEIVKRRNEDTKKQSDLLQMLIHANVHDKIELDEFDQLENHHANLTHESILEDQRYLVDSLGDENKEVDTKLSHFEVVSGAIFILAAALDSTRTLMTNLTYSLAFHPEAQEKLYEELKKIVEHSPDNKDEHLFNYEALTSCQYLDATISEALRILPPAIKTDRYTKRDYFIEKYNVSVPMGTEINVSIHAIQNDAEYWVEPDKFKPERFLPENRDKIVPGSYLPFSMGPRHCIGMRFSLTEAKLAVAKMTMKYKFSPAPGTKYLPDTKANIVLDALRNPIIIITPRA